MHRSDFVAALLMLAAFLFAGGIARFGSGVDVAEAASGPAVLSTPHSQLADSLTITGTTALLTGTDAPPRDLISLTQRLRLKGAVAVPTVVNPTQPDYKVGTKHTFRIADMTRNTYFTATATIWFVTPHAYWYVKDGYNVSRTALSAASQRFESHIYPTTRAAFGTEVNPGVDNDPRITVLLAPVPGVGGYFSSSDAYPRIVNSFSNERDMIYLASVPRGNVTDPGNYFMGTLAHEFQHMIHWNVHRDREIWVDEGCAEIAMWLNDYDVGGSDVSFALSPDTQLNAWTDTGDATEHYGASYLFLRYNMERFGNERFMRALLASKRLGARGFDEALTSLGYAGGFDGVFKDWTVANVLNDRRIAGGRYAYEEGGKVTPGRALSSYPATRSESVRQYGADYIKLGGKLKGATISFKGDGVARVVAAEPHGGRGFWYSNRRDSGDATLTREFDLTAVKKATLRFWTWFDIESLYDYGYVEASTDGGATWTVLKGRYTTDSNPNGTGYGQGWSGVSGAATRGSGKGTARWVEELVDLTPYTGRKVLVRFEYITDEGYNRPGLALDDMSIPEMGWKDDAEGDAGWRAEGWIRIGNRIPQQWHVALIERGTNGENRVREMIVEGGSGTLDITGLGSGTPTKDAILVISALAPKSTEPANYTVTIRQK